METETALAECQNVFGDAEVGRDPERSRRLKEDYAALGKKLKQLEEEYFSRSERGH